MQDQRAGVRVGNNHGVGVSRLSDYSWTVCGTGTDTIAELTEALGAAGRYSLSVKGGGGLNLSASDAEPMVRPVMQIRAV